MIVTKALKVNESRQYFDLTNVGFGLTKEDINTLVNHRPGWKKIVSSMSKRKFQPAFWRSIYFKRFKISALKKKADLSLLNIKNFAKVRELEKLQLELQDEGRFRCMRDFRSCFKNASNPAERLQCKSNLMECINNTCTGPYNAFQDDARERVCQEGRTAFVMRMRRNNPNIAEYGAACTDQMLQHKFDLTCPECRNDNECEQGICNKFNRCELDDNATQCKNIFEVTRAVAMGTFEELSLTKTNRVQSQYQNSTGETFDFHECMYKPALEEYTINFRNQDYNIRQGESLNRRLVQPQINRAFVQYAECMTQRSCAEPAMFHNPFSMFNGDDPFGQKDAAREFCNVPVEKYVEQKMQEQTFANRPSTSDEKRLQKKLQWKIYRKQNDTRKAVLLMKWLSWNLTFKKRFRPCTKRQLRLKYKRTCENNDPETVRHRACSDTESFVTEEHNKFWCIRFSLDPENVDDFFNILDTNTGATLSQRNFVNNLYKQPRFHRCTPAELDQKFIRNNCDQYTQSTTEFSKKFTEGLRSGAVRIENLDRTLRTLEDHMGNGLNNVGKDEATTFIPKWWRSAVSDARADELAQNQVLSYQSSFFKRYDPRNLDANNLFETYIPKLLMIAIAFWTFRVLYRNFSNPFEFDVDQFAGQVKQGVKEEAELLKNQVQNKLEDGHFLDESTANKLQKQLRDYRKNVDINKEAFVELLKTNDFDKLKKAFSGVDLDKLSENEDNSNAVKQLLQESLQKSGGSITQDSKEQIKKFLESSTRAKFLGQAVVLDDWVPKYLDVDTSDFELTDSFDPLKSVTNEAVSSHKEQLDRTLNAFNQAANTDDKVKQVAYRNGLQGLYSKSYEDVDKTGFQNEPKKFNLNTTTYEENVEQKAKEQFEEIVGTDQQGTDWWSNVYSNARDLLIGTNLTRAAIATKLSEDAKSVVRDINRQGLSKLAESPVQNTPLAKVVAGWGGQYLFGTPGVIAGSALYDVATKGAVDVRTVGGALATGLASTKMPVWFAKPAVDFVASKL